jgi:hypothetical protein
MLAVSPGPDVVSFGVGMVDLDSQRSSERAD